MEEENSYVKTTDHNAMKMYSSFQISHYRIHWKISGTTDVTNSGQIKFRQIKSKVVPVHTMMAYDGKEVQLHSFLSSALQRSQW